MLISEGYPFRYGAQTTAMFVLRNNGYCWGQFRLPDGRVFDVQNEHDYYDDPDDFAAECFIEIAQDDPNSVHTAVSPRI